MCDSGPSSKWGSVAREFSNPWMEDLGLIKHDKLTKSYVKNKVLTKHLEGLTFAGGEPLLSKVASEYVTHLIDTGIIDTMTEIHLITNGTFELTDVWKEAFVDVIVLIFPLVLMEQIVIMNILENTLILKM